MESDNQSSQFNLVSATVMLIVALMIGSLFLMSTTRSRELAATTTCANRLKKIGLALHNYHSAYKKLPAGAGGTDGRGVPEMGNDHRLSGIAALLPFLEQQALWEKLANPYKVGESQLPPMGPDPSYDPAVYKLWAHQVPDFLCPSEPVSPGDYGLCSYVLCYGDGIENVAKAITGPATADRQLLNEQRAVARGMFTRVKMFRFRDVLDGLSNTIMVSETAIGIGDSIAIGNVARDVDGVAESPAIVLGLAEGEVNKKAYRDDQNIWQQGKGSRWADGAFRISGFNTVLPPNSPSCTTNNEWSGVMSASSHHLDGVHILTGDGAVRFASSSIDTGDLTKPSIALRFNNAGQESPYGIWGALGTRGSRELMDGRTMSKWVTSPPNNTVSRSGKTITAETFIERLDNIERTQAEILKKLDQIQNQR